jgi:LEA14-like dessication related protein
VLRAAALAATLAAAMAGGCKALGELAAGAPKPSVSVQKVRLGDLSLDGVTLLFDAEVSNPYPADLPLVNLEYGLTISGARFLDGSAPVHGTVPTKGVKAVTLPAKVSFRPLLAAVSGVRPGAVVPYTADLNLSVDLPAVAGGGRVALPISRSGDLPVPAVPEISLAGLHLGEVGLSKAAATLSLTIKNTNQFPVDLSRLAFALDLSGSRVGSTSLARRVALKPGDTGVVDIPIELSLTRLGLSAFNTLRGKSAGYGLTGDLTVETPFGPIEMPLAGSGTTKVSS